MEENWKLITITPDTAFFRDVFQQVIKHPDTQYPKEEVNINANNKKFLFKFKWQDENICGIEVFESF